MDKEKNTVAKDVDQYLKEVPPDARKALEKLRTIIKKAAPMATEKISYRMPVYYYLGPLVGFAAFKDHCSFFGMSYSVMEILKDEIAPFKAAKSTLHFTADNPLPPSLVKKIVEARIKENEAKKHKK